jgi:hypothetical protein
MACVHRDRPLAVPHAHRMSRQARCETGKGVEVFRRMQPDHRTRPQNKSGAKRLRRWDWRIWAGIVAAALIAGGVTWAVLSPAAARCESTASDVACNTVAPGSPSADPTPVQPTPLQSTPVQPSQAATPPPAPPVPGINCLQQLAACGFPNSTNTGVQPGVTLDTVNGDVTLSTAGQVYQGHEVHGCITVAAAGVTVRNVKIVGVCNYSIDTARGPAYESGPTTIEHVEIDCQNAGGTTAIGEKHLIVRAVNIHGCENGFDLDGATTISESWIHDLVQSEIAHTDGIQATPGAAGIAVSHTVLDSRGITTSAVITTVPSAGGNTNVTLTGNLLAGGAYTLYCSDNGSGWAVTGNRFVPGGYSYATNCENVPVWSGNILDATGAPALPLA